MYITRPASYDDDIASYLHSMDDQDIHTMPISLPRPGGDAASYNAVFVGGTTDYCVAWRDVGEIRELVVPRRHMEDDESNVAHYIAEKLGMLPTGTDTRAAADVEKVLESAGAEFLGRPLWVQEIDEIMRTSAHD